ncbi:YhcN/YlaJ family sporulation lipoprotein [Virgibacillus xinjiangensis]|uniref:YhcN/YlaJ family sporulation lipoprotein n=1 Tax=Virgibacillus xinjiangensis TaxID=393090 RepID=A0ABV7CS38_9BACI
MKKLIVSSVVLYIGLLSGCAGDPAENENAEGVESQPIRYDAQGENSQKMENEESIGKEGPKGYPQQYQDRANSSEYENGYSDPYTDEETKRIAEKLKELEGIVGAQVETTDDRLFIALQLKEHTDPDKPGQIEEQVRSMVPETGKQVIIFTDRAHWDRMKSLDSRGTSGEDTNDLFDEYEFPQED